MEQRFVVGLGEKRGLPERGIRRSAAVYILNIMAFNLGVDVGEFGVTDVNRRTGAYYVVFYRASYRRIFMRYMADLGVAAREMHGSPPLIRYPVPPFDSLPPLTEKGRRFIEGRKFYENTLKMIREELKRIEDEE